MEILLLKSTACLAILILFYKLVLENQSFHQFKRFYLLGAITASLIIPFISFTQYVEVSSVENLDLSSALTPYLPIDGELQGIERPINYWPIILWSIYGLGVLIFLVRFIKNLSRLLIKIKVNEKIKKTSYTEVLLKQLEPPHTFFNYIFFNRDKAKAKAIPNEVVLHEASHAKQKHSLDILFIEVLQIVFWFNPLLYFIKKDIKLNHEFLADAEVLNNNIESTNYKKILLEFAHPHQDYALANTINYSSIKKRFTVMKTQTSKKRLWLSTFVLLPLLGLLLYSFSSREIIEIDTHSARNIDIEVLKNGGYTINDIKTNKADFVKTANKFHQDISSDVRNRIINIHLSFEAEETEEEVWFVYNSLLDYGFHRLVTKNQEVVKSKGNTPMRRSYAANSILINGKNCDPCELTKKEILDMKLTSSNGNKVNSFAVKFKGYPTQGNQGNTLNKKTKAIVSQYNDNSPAQIFNIKIKGSKENFSKLILIKQQKEVTENELKAYNNWAKKMKAEFKKRPKLETVNGHPYIINDESFRYYNSIFDRMTTKQKNEAESMPEAVLVTEWPMPTYEVIETIPVKEQQNPPTQKEVAAYNAWAKNINDKTKAAEADKTKKYPIVKQKEVVKYKAIYNRMSEKQKANAQPWPNFPPPPPPPAAQNKGSNDLPPPPPPPKASDKQVAAYNAWAEKMNKKPMEERIIKLKDFKYYESIYKIMTDEQRENAQPLPDVPPPPPPAPKTDKKTKGGPNNTVRSITEISDYDARKTILYASKKQTKPVNYYVNGTLSTVEEVVAYLKKNNDADMSFEKGKPNKFKFTDNKGKKMTIYQLRDLYSEVFKTYDSSDDGKIKYYRVEPIKKSKEKGGPNADGYSYKTISYSASKKRRFYISISTNGDLAFVKGQLINPTFTPTSINEIEKFMNKLSVTELKNTFIFTNGNDLKTYRSLPSSTPEYQDDIEIYLIKSKDSESKRSQALHESMKKVKPKSFGYELALDNDQNLKNQTLKLITIFKKYKGIHTTH